ncbi:MAG: hypothetical protein LBS51_00735 [Oscillospiraceae bacterium]|jgi:hypothetical protein|nr:hypothetical protein [Oscillospiraceae bacterium]
MRFLEVPTWALTALTLLFAASCSERAKPETLEAGIKDVFRGAESVETTADITADYGDGVFSFSVKYTGSADMGTVEILEPERIAGITARVVFPECSLEYDGLSLEAGALTGDGLSPVQALPALLGQWTDGYAELMSFELLDGIDALAVETRITEDSSQRTWFDAETLLPMRSEIYGDGRMVIVCEIESIEIS